MSKEIVKSEYKVYYSRMARAYYVIIMNCHHYFLTRKDAQAFCDKMEAQLLNA